MGAGAFLALKPRLFVILNALTTPKGCVVNAIGVRHSCRIDGVSITRRIERGGKVTRSKRTNTVRRLCRPMGFLQRIKSACYWRKAACVRFVGARLAAIACQWITAIVPDVFVPFSVVGVTRQLGC